MTNPQAHQSLDDDRTIEDMELFDRIYGDAKRATSKANELHKRRVAGQLTLIERSIIRFPALWVFGVIAAVAVAAVVAGWLRAPAVTVSVITILGQVGYIVVLFRFITFKGSVSGIRKFYSEARFLHRAYSEKGRKLSSLRLALDTYISDQSISIAAFTGLGATLALYVAIDEAGFSGATKSLDKLFNAFFIDNVLSNRKMFFILFTGLCSFVMLKFYLPKVWAEQVKRNLDHLCASEGDK